VDGGDLRLSRACGASTQYLRDPWEITSADFKEYCLLRINALPEKKRLNRGRRGDTKCRACRSAGACYPVMPPDA